MLPDEGRYVGVAWEMIRSGDWLTPTLNGLPYFHKPPLFYWITAASMSVFGVNEWAARVAPVIGATIGTLALWRFVAINLGNRLARHALIVLVSFSLWYLGGQFANLDMLVAGCITLTIVLLAEAALRIERDDAWRMPLAAAFAFAALGVLGKGLIGAVIPALVIGAWLLIARRWQTLVTLIWWPGIVLFAVLVLPWFAAMQWLHPGFLHYFIVVQHFQRFAGSGFNNVQPIWFFPAVLLIACLPWWPWIPAAFRAVVTTTTRAFKRGETGADWVTERGLSIRLLMVIWFCVVLAFFSLPSSKLLGYILPAVPPLAFLIANGYMSLAARSERSRRLWVAGTSIAIALNLVSIAFFAFRTTQSSHELVALLDMHRKAGDPVIMLNRYYFDVPFYARLRVPIAIADDWSTGNVQRSDNWRKEIADAADYAPDRARSVLISPEGLSERLCTSGAHWLIGGKDSAAQYPFLDVAWLVGGADGSALWRVDPARPALAAALGCAAYPRPDSLPSPLAIGKLTPTSRP